MSVQDERCLFRIQVTPSGGFDLRDNFDHLPV